MPLRPTTMRRKQETMCMCIARGLHPNYHNVINTCLMKNSYGDIEDAFAISYSFSLSPLSSTSARSMPFSFLSRSRGEPNSACRKSVSRTELTVKDTGTYDSAGIEYQLV